MTFRRFCALVLVPGVLAALGACGADPESKPSEIASPAAEGRAGPASNNVAAGGSLRPNGAPSDDRGLAGKVKDALLRDPETTARQITVQAVGGEITLSGFVDSAGEKMAAARVARAVTGVERVENNLAVGHTDDEVGDGALASRVKAALVQDNATSGRQVNVDVLQGVAQLSGYVDTPDERRRAAEVAAEVKGVRSVQNKLEVKSKEPSAPSGDRPNDKGEAKAKAP
jgi:osmotically-inducible protein OsmY